MRTANALFAAGLLIAALPAAAHAQWYVGADVGANYTQDSSVSAGTTNNTTYNWGPVGLIQGGYSFGAPKLEAEIGYRSNDVNNVGSASGGGSADSLSLMANGVYDFGDMVNGGAWHPFVGAGVGAAKVTSNDISRSSAFAYSGSDWKFAYQGFAGLGYDVTSNLMAKLQYRYFATADYGVNGAGATSGDAEYRNHAVLVGLTYKFNPPPAPPPAPAPVAAAQPAPAPAVKPAPAPRNFMVFFDFDKASITPEAAKIIRDAAGAAKMGSVARVNLTGHTDTAGPAKYNMTLSLKRANAVRAAMEQQGIPASEIVVVGKGETDPLVPTKDGVREPQNRRVEIVLQ